MSETPSPHPRPGSGARGSESPEGERLAGGRLTIDLGALSANWRLLDEQSGTAECAAAIKGDGYGIGLEQAASVLWKAGCRTFFVALPDEGLRAREILPAEATVHILNGLLPGLAPLYEEARLIPVLGSMPEAEDWAAHCRSSGKRLPATLHIDTGMNRLGLSMAEAATLAGRTDLMDAFDTVLVMSHLACASEGTHPLNGQQVERFREAAALFPGVPRSLANSAGILLGADYHFDLVRPGIALYGGEALDDTKNPMRPVVTLEARVLTVREGRHGESVGYGATRQLERDSRIAILAAGYADGYHRLAGTGGDTPAAHAWIAGRRAPLLGRVSMDLIAVDVTDLSPDACQRGDWVELFGPNIAVDEVARSARTIGYELLTGLGRRYTRRYI